MSACASNLHSSRDRLRGAMNSLARVLGRHQPFQILACVRGAGASPKALRWASTIEQLAAQPAERSRIVDVIPGGQGHQLEPDAARAFGGLPIYPFRAPVDLME